MNTFNNNGIYPDERLEELLLNLRPDQRDEPLHPRVDDLTRRRMVGAALANWEDANSKQLAGGKNKNYTAMIAVAAALLAAVLLASYLIIGTQNDPSRDATLTQANARTSGFGDKMQLVPQSRFSLLHGDVNCGNTAVKLGGSVPLKQWIETRQGQGAFVLPTGIAVGLADNSSVRVFWNGKRRYEVEISQGRALFSVNPDKVREGFFVRTPNGVVKVTGTLFTVRVSDEGDVEVQLHRGKVEIQDTRKETIYVHAGETASLRNQTTEVNASSTSPEVTSPLFRLGCFDGGQTFSELTHQDCDSIAVSAATSDEAVSTGKVILHKSRIHAGKFKQNQDKTLESMSELLTAARKARKDENWEAAAAMYGQLIRDYPGTANSRTALVSLAEIELKYLQRPKSALKHFNAYLAAPGTLEREALYGKAKVYRLTNARANEIKTLRTLVGKYPNGPISQAANKRLQDLADQ